MDESQNAQGITYDLGYQLVTNPDNQHSLRLGVSLEYPEEGINVSLITFDNEMEIVESLEGTVSLDEIESLADYFYNVSQMLRHFQAPSSD